MTEALYIIISLSSVEINRKLQQLSRPLAERSHLESNTDGLYSIVPLANGQQALLINPALEVKVSDAADIHALDGLWDSAISATSDATMKAYLEQRKVALQEAIQLHKGQIINVFDVLIKLTPWGQPYSETNLMGYRTYEQMVAQELIIESTI